MPPPTSIQPLEKSADHYFRKSTSIYGASGSGKSTIILEILYLLKALIPIIFVFSPTASQTGSYDGIAPKKLIFHSLDMKRLLAIYNRQESAGKVYRFVNDVDKLFPLFRKASTQSHRDKVAGIIANTEDFIQKLKDDMSLSDAKRADDINELKILRDECLCSFYKHIIHNNKERLIRLHLNDEELFILKYLYFNPNILVIFDDCTADFTRKIQTHPIVKKIFFQGRHLFITSVFAFHDDTSLDTPLRKNSFVNIFTTEQCAFAYFDRTSNSFSKPDKQLANKLSDEIYTDTHEYRYRKLVYLRGVKNPFRYTIANKYPVFKFGNRSLWELCDRVDRTETKFNVNDPSMMSFGL